ncbi:MAG: amino acid racemase [Eubacterium sp.]|nr:amino acid racemase [Eubacterium sp.]
MKTEIKSEKTKHMLGILGGMGPEATSVLYKRITDRTVVSCDQEHIDILIYSHAGLPDRTGCILCGESEQLWEMLLKDIRMLKNAGCEYLAVPCNTCHFFGDRFQKEMDGHFINMIEETAKYVARRRYHKVGILATDGTVQADLYRKELLKLDVEAVYPDEIRQKDVMTLIYDQIKRGEKGDKHLFQKIAQHMHARGCEAVVLACTELSVFAVNHELTGGFYIDAMEALAEQCIERCGGVYSY